MISASAMPNQKEFEMSELAAKVMFELDVVAFNVLLETPEPEKALLALRPYKKMHAHNMLIITRQKFKMQGNDPTSMLLPLFFAQMALDGPENVEAEIFEKGAKGVVHKCPYQSMRPEFCVAISHFTSEAICDALDPNYEFLFTHHLTNGDPYCRYLVKKRSASMDMGKMISKVEIPPIPPSELTQMRAWIFSNIWNAVTSAIVDIYGSEKATEMLVPKAREIGVRLGKDLKQSGIDIPADAVRLGALFDQFGKGSMQDGDFIVLNGEAHKTIFGCQFQTAAPELCQQLEAVFDGFCESINPEIEFKYSSMRSKGQRSCQWSVRRKGAENDQIVSQTVLSDPMAVIKLRLAKGEISLEEYERIRNALV